MSISGVTKLLHLHLNHNNADLIYSSFRVAQKTRVANGHASVLLEGGEVSGQSHKSDIKKFQIATHLHARDKIQGGKIIRVEAHPVPEHPRPRKVVDRVALVGDAAGYVTKCSDKGIYFAVKSGRMCTEPIVEGSENGNWMVEEGDLRRYLEKWDKTHGGACFCS